MELFLVIEVPAKMHQVTTVFGGLRKLLRLLVCLPAGCMWHGPPST